MGSLVAAYTVAWVILMIYVLTLAARQKKLRQALAQLQAQVEAAPAAPSQAAHAK
ncbi:MAG TPA: CcmD family protein [Terriglobales bacterium]|nr:CcmD family protein [Terriglobales bacterium]